MVLWVSGCFAPVDPEAHTDTASEGPSHSTTTDTATIGGTLPHITTSSTSPGTTSDLAGMCGNGIVETGEECDDGNYNDDDDCTSSCRTNECSTGGGIDCNGVSTIGDDGCSSNCPPDGESTGTGTGTETGTVVGSTEGVLNTSTMPDDGESSTQDETTSSVEGPPELDRVEPSAGVVSANIILSGTGFGIQDDASEVLFDGTSAVIVSWSETEVVVAVPNLYPGTVAVTVSSATGSTMPMNFTVELPQMVYVANRSRVAGANDFISAFRFNPDSGTGVELSSSPYTIGETTPITFFNLCPSRIAVHRPTRRLFALSRRAVSVFEINPSTGGLTESDGSPIDIESTDSALALELNHAGDRLYVSTYGNAQGSGAALILFHIPETGLPEVDPDGVLTIGTGFENIALSPEERQLLVEGRSTGGSFSIESNGTLGPILWGTQIGVTSSILARPQSSQVYFHIDGTIAVRTIADEAAAGTQAIFVVPPSRSNMAFSPDGEVLYFGDHDDASIFAFDLEPGGEPLPRSPFDISDDINATTCIATTADGSYLFAVSHGDSGLAALQIDDNGALSTVAGSPILGRGMSLPSWIVTTF